MERIRVQTYWRFFYHVAGCVHHSFCIPIDPDHILTEKNLDILQRRAYRTFPGAFTVGDVNALLDQLADASSEYVLNFLPYLTIIRDTRVNILEQFYRSLSPLELRWLIPILLKGWLEMIFLYL